MDGNILNSLGVHVGVVRGEEALDLKGERLYPIKGSKIYRLSGELIGHLAAAQRGEAPRQGYRQAFRHVDPE